MATSAQRRSIGRILDLLVHDAYEVRYPPHDVRTHKAHEVQTMHDLTSRLQMGTFEFDCSQTAEIVAVVAGLKWPRLMRDGYTGTMLRGLPNYSDPSRALTGAFVVFGPGTGVHVCQVRHPGKNPTLYSHGSDRSSHFISFSQEKTHHPGPVRFLSIAGL